MIPATLRSIGVTKATPPEELARLRAERARHVQKLEHDIHQRNLRLADYLESHPEIVAPTLQRVTQLLDSPSHLRLHWALERWKAVLESQDIQAIAEIFRDTSEQSRDLRETAPFSGDDIAKL